MYKKMVVAVDLLHKKIITQHYFLDTNKFHLSISVWKANFFFPIYKASLNSNIQYSTKKPEKKYFIIKTSQMKN